MILYVKGDVSVKRYRAMLRDLGVSWYCVRGRQFVYEVAISKDTAYDVTIKLVTIEVDEAGAALFKLRWPELFVPTA